MPRPNPVGRRGYCIPGRAPLRSTCGCKLHSASAGWSAPVGVFWFWSFPTSLPAEAEEEIAVAVCAGDRLGHGRERLIDLAFELKTVRQHVDLKGLRSGLPREDCARHRQAVVRE